MCRLKLLFYINEWKKLKFRINLENWKKYIYIYKLQKPYEYRRVESI